MINEYEIYALKYAGPSPGPGAMGIWNKDWDKMISYSFYLWCIKGNNETIVVDTGETPSFAMEMKLPEYSSPVEVLSRIKVKAEEVRKVIITHCHRDHVNGVSLFPNATFYLQEAEYYFWAKNPIASRPPFKYSLDETAIGYLKSLEGTDRLSLLQGDQKILPGIECLLAGGHTIANQAVAVNTNKGTAIIGSDCGHFFRNYREDWPSIFITNLVEWMKSYDKLRAKASSMDLLFPGHDPIMTENYPKIAEGITRLV
ncbi:MAG: N-acyl homoserine lactonase family protein [Candidatus Lokiarchaeota archaeon]|nr:N-acyl homoserine lactonase family protein [Candidatus Lokiarchaeota archaeon]